MPLTFAERQRYLRDRIVNAARMLRHGNFNLFWESLVFEINHVKNLFKMWWRSRREVARGEEAGHALTDKSRVTPDSWRPTAYRPAAPTAPHDKSNELANELAKIRLRLKPREDGEGTSKWSKLRF